METAENLCLGFGCRGKRNFAKVSGYEVHDSDTDLHWARPVLEFEAYKGSLEYKIVMSYPDLNIIEERVDL